MDYKRMLYFCTIVEQGQISRAAKVLNMSQPPLSQRLKEVEDEVGTPLILRGPKQWQVTEAGQALYRKAQVILSQIDALSGEVCSAITPHKGYLPTIIPLYFLSPKTRKKPLQIFIRKGFNFWWELQGSNL